MFSVLFVSCDEETGDTDTDYNIENETVEVKEAFEQTQKIFYSLPTSVETGLVLEKTEVIFSDTYILPLANAPYFETTYQKALNLGVYSADLSYLTIFNQTQQEIDYMATCKKLAEDIGIMNIINDSVINQVQQNLNNRDKVLNIISEQFTEVNSYLEVNNRSITATLIVLGGWVEGLYVSSMLVDKVENNTELSKMIYEQKYSLKDLIGLLELYKNEKIIKDYLTDLRELEYIFDNIENEMTQKEFEKLKSKVTLIRNIYTKI